MTTIPENLLYTKEDEWILVEGDEAKIGITDYAQDSLSDLVYIELPEVGESYAMAEVFGTVESVKAAADLYMPVSGEVVETNDDLLDAPENANTDPYGEGWMIKVKLTNPGELDDLMNSAAYTAYCEERG